MRTEAKMSCNTCGKHIEISPDFVEWMSQMQYHAQIETECIKCAGQRARIMRNNYEAMVEQGVL